MYDNFPLYPANALDCINYEFINFFWKLHCFYTKALLTLVIVFYETYSKTQHMLFKLKINKALNSIYINYCLS